MAHNLKINLGIDNPSLYEVGFLTTDLFHLALTAELAERDRKRELKELYFNTVGEYKHPSRYELTPFYEEFHEKFRVSELRVGSLELILTGLGTAASIIVPTVLFVLDRRLKRSEAAIQFNVKTDNKVAHNFLEYLEKEGVDNLDKAFMMAREYLIFHGLSMTAVGDDVYKIVDATTNRAQRTLETVYKVQHKG